MKVVTYTSYFEEAEMNALVHFFGGPDKGKHVGCLFYLTRRGMIT
jgi:hypothetical protein